MNNDKSEAVGVYSLCISDVPKLKIISLLNVISTIVLASGKCRVVWPYQHTEKKDSQHLQLGKAVLHKVE